MKLTLFETVHWLGLTLKVPREWQIVRHGLSPELGSLVWIDRRRQRLKLTWTQCRHQPDIERLISDEKARQLADTENQELGSLVAPHPFRGFTQRHASSGETLHRAVCFDRRTSRLVELEVTTLDRAENEQELPFKLMKQLQIGGIEGAQRWRAFGLEVLAPPEFQLTKTQVNATDVTLTFQNNSAKNGAPKQQLAHVRRLALADTWFHGNLEQPLLEGAPKALFKQFRNVSFAGHAALYAAGSEPAPPYTRWRQREKQWHALAWHCESENVVYSVSAFGLAKAPLMPEVFRLRCAPPPGESS